MPLWRNEGMSTTRSRRPSERSASKGPVNSIHKSRTTSILWKLGKHPQRWIPATPYLRPRVDTSRVWWKRLISRERFPLSFHMVQALEPHTIVRFFYVGTLKESIFFDHHLWSIFQSSTHISNYNLSHVGPQWAASMYCIYTCKSKYWEKGISAS